MSNTVRTTITLPQELFEEATLAAYYKKTSLSDIIRQALKKSIKGEITYIDKKDFVKFLGRHNLGIKKVKRETIYEDYLGEKVSA